MQKRDKKRNKEAFFNDKTILSGNKHSTTLDQWIETPWIEKLWSLSNDKIPEIQPARQSAHQAKHFKSSSLDARRMGYLGVGLQNVDAEGLEDEPAIGAAVGGADARRWKDAGLGHPSGNALRHVPGSNETKLEHVRCRDRRHGRWRLRPPGGYLRGLWGGRARKLRRLVARVRFVNAYGSYTTRAMSDHLGSA